MSNGSVRGLNLYSFYAILLPGVAFLLILVPLFPAQMKIDLLAALIPVAATGFILGQAIHTLAVIVQGVSNIDRTSTSHRELFNALIKDENLIFETQISDDLVQRFIKSVNQSFDSITIEDNIQTTRSPDQLEAPVVPWVTTAVPMLSADLDSSDSQIATVYTLVRGRIHMDGTGRSRVFQSTYAFCRSVFVGLPIVWIIYSVYAVSDAINLVSILTKILNLQSESALFYQPIIATVIDEPTVVVLIATVTILPLIFLFSEAMEQYKQYYVEYTMADFILITDESEKSS